MTSLSTFPLPLLRLVLLGGGGLAPAWGPLFHTQRGLTAFDPWYSVPCGGHSVRLPHPALSEIGGWSLPLDASSPWPARLARVAAWMLGGWGDFATVHKDLSDLIVVASWRGPWQEPDRWTWTLGGGAAAAPFDLPTLPRYLKSDPPEVALLLALFDVPEIRARVEAVCPA